MSGPPITSSKLATGQRSKCGTSKTLTNLDERIEFVRKNSIFCRKREGMKINQLRDRNINDHFICFYDEINKLHFVHFVYLAVICWGNFLFRSIDFPYNKTNEFTKLYSTQTLDKNNLRICMRHISHKGLILNTSSNDG